MFSSSSYGNNSYWWNLYNDGSDSAKIKRWKKIHQFDDADAYIENSTIQFSFDWVSFNYLVDFFVPLTQGKSTLSMVTRKEINCDNKKIKNTWHKTYPQSMGKGEPTRSWRPPNDWITIDPHTLNHKLYKVLCQTD